LATPEESTAVHNEPGKAVGSPKQPPDTEPESRLRSIRLGKYVVEVNPLLFRPVDNDANHWKAESPVATYEIFHVGNQWVALVSGAMPGKKHSPTLIAAVKACNDRHKDIVISQLHVKEFMKPVAIPKVVSLAYGSLDDFLMAVSEVLAEGGCTMCASDRLTIRAMENFTFGSALVCDACGRTLVELKPVELDHMD